MSPNFSSSRLRETCPAALLSVVISALLSFCLGCMGVCRIALTPSSTVCQSTQCLSFVHHVTFANRLYQRWKSHLTPFKVELRLQPCDRSTICALPHGLSLPPHFTASDALTEIKLPKSWPPAGTPSESANDPVCLRRNQLFFSCVCPLPSPRLCSYFIVITLPLVRHLYDLNCLKGGGRLNFHCRSVSLVGE